MAPHRDPLTGNELTTSAWVSLKLQGILRSWWAFGVINAVTLYVWIFVDPIWHHSPADIINYCLSLWAVDVEMIVGMFFFRLNIGDSAILRRILKDVENDNRTGSDSQGPGGTSVHQ